MAHLSGARVDRKIFAFAIVGSQHRVKNRRAIVDEVVIHLRSAERILTVARMDCTFEVDALNRRGINRPHALTKSSQRVRREKNHTALRRKLKSTLCAGDRCDVLKFHHPLHGDTVELLVDHHGICRKSNCSIGSKDRQRANGGSGERNGIRK